MFNRAEDQQAPISNVNYRPRLATFLRNGIHFRMSPTTIESGLAKIYEERANAADADRRVTYFFLEDYQEIRRYMRTIGYGSKG
jgi:hypothetical protein